MVALLLLCQGSIITAPLRVSRVPPMQPRGLEIANVVILQVGKGRQSLWRLHDYNGHGAKNQNRHGKQKDSKVFPHSLG